MDIIKRQLDMVIVGAFALVLTFVLFGLIFTSTKQMRELESEVQSIRDKEKTFLSLDYALDLRNQSQAIENMELAKESVDSLLKRLVDRYSYPQNEKHGYTALEFKRTLQGRTEVMCQALEFNEVRYPTTLKTFGFEHFLQERVIPGSGPIALVLTQLDIYERMVDIITKSRVSEIKALKFRGDVKQPTLTSRDLFSFCTYDVTLTGDVNSLQRFARELNNSNYLFVVRWSHIEAQDLKPQIVIPDSPMATPGTRSSIRETNEFDPGVGPGGRPGSGRGPRGEPPRTVVVTPAVPQTASVEELLSKPKAERLIFKDLAQVTQTMQIDYVQFNAE